MKPNKEPVWILRAAVEAIQRDQIIEHSGLAGIRDVSALDAALGRPQNKFAHDDEADMATLAAAYAFGIAKNHPFNDGNKRVALVTLVTFLMRNGQNYDAPPAEELHAILALAAGHLSEPRFAAWLRLHLKSSRRRRIAARR